MKQPFPTKLVCDYLGLPDGNSTLALTENLGQRRNMMAFQILGIGQPANIWVKSAIHDASPNRI